MTTLSLADLRRDQAASLAELIRDNPEATDAVFGTIQPKWTRINEAWVQRDHVLTRDLNGNLTDYPADLAKWKADMEDENERYRD